jgi:signal recognition particle subunit SRP54
MQAMMGGKGGLPGLEGADPAQLEAAARQMGRGGMPGLGSGMSLPPGLSGFGKKK